MPPVSAHQGVGCHISKTGGGGAEIMLWGNSVFKKGGENFPLRNFPRTHFTFSSTRYNTPAPDFCNP